MCEYCEKSKTMMVRDEINTANFGWGYDDKIKLTLREAEGDPNKLGIFIDRGYLRIVDLCDCGCLDAGEKLKINFCPVCGDKIKHG